MNNKRVYIILPDYEAKIDLGTVLPVAVTYNVADIRDISTKKGSLTKQLTIPGTKENVQILGNLYNINVIESTFDLQTKTKAILYEDDGVVIKGYMRLTGVNKTSKTYNQTGEQLINFDAVIFDDTTNFFTDAENLRLEDLDLSQYDHTLSYETIWSTSAKTASNSAFAYFNLHNNNTNYYKTLDFKPGVFVKTYFDAAFDYLNYSYTIDIGDEDLWNRLIIPFNGGEGQVKISADELGSRKFRSSVSGSSGHYRLYRIATGGTSQGVQVLPYNDETTSPNFDSGGTYNPTLFKYTSPNNQESDFNVGFVCRFWLSANTASVKDTSGFNSSFKPAIGLYKNGVSVGLTQVFFNGVFPSVANSGLTQIGSGVITAATSYVSVGGGGSNQLQLNIGDTIEAKLIFPGMCLYYQSGTTTANQDIAVLFDIITTANTANNYFYNNPYQSIITDGDEVVLNDWVPRNVKFKEVFKEIVDRFNIYVEIDKTNDRRLILKSRDIYYSGNSYVNWTDKIDYNLPHSIQFLPELSNKEILFADKTDSDLLNKSYEEKIKEIYSQQLIQFTNEYVTGQKRIGGLLFSPTPITYNGFGNLVPYIDSQQPKNNLRLLYFGGAQTSLNTWNFNYKLSGVSTTVTETKGLWAGHLDNPIAPTLDIGWGQNQFLFYNDWSYLTDNNIYNRYWYSYISQIPEGRLLTAYFDLDILDILNLDFRKRVLIKDTYYLLMKVIDYNPTAPGKTKCELLRIETGVRFSPRTGTTIFNQISNSHIAEIVASPISTSPNNNVTAGNSVVAGEDNYVSNDLDSGLVVGNSNTISGTRGTNVVIGTGNTASGERHFIFGDSNNATIDSNSFRSFIVGSGNTAYTDNVFVFGNNIAADTSNTAYFTNVKILSGFSLADGVSISGMSKTLADYYTNSGNTTTATTTLYQYSLPANQLLGTGDKIEGKFAGIFSGTPNNKTIQVHFGGQIIFNSKALTITADHYWELEVLLMRTSNSTSRSTVRFTNSSTIGNSNCAAAELTGLDFSASQNLQVIGIATATNDIVAGVGTIQFVPKAN